MSGWQKARQVFELGRELFDLGRTVVDALERDDPQRVDEILPDELLSRVQYELTQAKMRAQYGPQGGGS